MSEKFRVAINREMLNDAGEFPPYDMGIDILRAEPRIELVPLAKFTTEITPDLIRDFDACIAGVPRWNRAAFAGVEGRFLCVARWGVGFDNVDVAACTDADVMLTTTRGALDYSVAESALAFMLACCHRMLFKDKMARQGRWKERTWTLGTELREKTLGIVGLGAIGSTLVRLVAPFRPAKVLAFDPFARPERAREIGVELTDLPALLRQSDFVSIHCPRTPETTDLIRAEQLAMMKPTAYLINTARGGIVNQKALYEALKAGVIRGAGIDVFEVEPPPADEPLFTLDNVIVSPHANSLTEECWRDIGRHVCRNLVRIVHGQEPEYVVNAEVLKKESFRKKWEACRKRTG
jgi:phosphoglycerate dehydrogenase-like enzyme